MAVNRTEQVQINQTISTIGELCHLSKNLYNEANYIVRQEFFNNGRWIRYTELNQRMKDTSENYNSLPVQTAQQILKLLDKSWLSFFEAMKEWRTNPEQFQGKPKPPKYKKKNGHHLVVFTNQQCSIRVPSQTS